jgi:hypothetical protein
MNPTLDVPMHKKLHSLQDPFAVPLLQGIDGFTNQAPKLFR